MQIEKKIKIQLKIEILKNEILSEKKQFEITDDLNKFLKSNKLKFNNKEISHFHQSEVSKLLNVEKIAFEKYLSFLYFLVNQYNIDLNKIFKKN